MEKWKTTSTPVNISVFRIKNYVDWNKISCGSCGENFSLKTFLFLKKGYSEGYTQVIYKLSTMLFTLSRIDLLHNNADSIMKCLILGYLFLDLFYSILDGGVVLTAEYDADCLQRGLGKSPHQIHGDLPRNRDAGASLVALKVGDRNIEMIRYNIKDQFGGYSLLL